MINHFTKTVIEWHNCLGSLKTALLLVTEKDSMSFTGLPNIAAWMIINPQNIFQIPLCLHQTFN